MSMSYSADIRYCDGRDLSKELMDRFEKEPDAKIDTLSDPQHIHLRGIIHKSVTKLLDDVAKFNDGLVLVYSSEYSLYEEESISVSCNGEWQEISKHNSHVMDWQQLYHNLKRAKGNNPDDSAFIESMRDLIGEILSMPNFDLTDLEVLNRKEVSLKNDLKKIAEEKKNLKNRRKTVDEKNAEIDDLFK